MGLDKNQIIGFILIGALLIAMFAINSKSRLAYEANQKRIADSIKALQPQETIKDTLVKNTTIAPQPSTASFSLFSGKETLTVLENDVVKISFSNKGGQPSKVELKKYDKLDKSPVILQSSNSENISYRVKAGQNHTEEVSNLSFRPSAIIKNADNSQSLIFTAADTLGNSISHVYRLPSNDYLLDFSISIKGKDNLISGNNLALQWTTEALAVEENKEYEKTQTHICHYGKDGFDFEYLGNGSDLSLQTPVNWVALKQQFFAKALIAKNAFSSAPVSWKPDTSAKRIAGMTMRADVALNSGSFTEIPLQLYYGPSDYNILKRYHNSLENIVPYGSGVFAFVKYINRYFLLPVFDFFQKFIANMGIVILLLTLLIRLITSPILYKSYLSGAKMKVLKPEVDALKAKFTDPKTKELDQQAFSMEQMKLWKTAGVSPLGGCIPALLQIPIFMSLYYFFQSNIDLRGKTFLWAKDLASFDSIAHLPFSIPFYGNHVSLFTLTAVATSLLISLYSMSSMQDNSNPMMKYMPYIFPVMLLGVFNSLPAALTWYYTVSNFITLILQFIIQKYIINHDKIVAEIAENKKKPVKKSKFQERLEAMQESQRKLQDMKNKSRK